MEIKKHIQIVSAMIVFVVLFIFVVTSFSKKFYFQAYGNKESVSAVLSDVNSLNNSTFNTDKPAHFDSESEDLAEINKDEAVRGNAAPNSFSRSTDTSLRKDDGLDKDDELDRDFALPGIEIEDGAEREFVVLMFHDIIDSHFVPDSTFLSRSTFESILMLIKERGYQTIDVRDLMDFVEGKKDLPPKSVILTFDDGYNSNYRLVYPILKREGLKAIFFPIGVSVGKRHYKGSELEIIRHYSIENMQEMQGSGLVEFGSHSFDMHQNVELEAILGNQNPRVTILKLDTETEEDYIDLFQRDIALNNELYKDTGIELLSFSCPRGGHDELSIKMLKQAGFKSIFISKTGINTVVKGNPESLYLLKRYNISEDTDYNSLLP